MNNEMTALTEFSFENLGVRVLGPRYDPWFVAADVFRALEIPLNYMARSMKRLDDDEKGIVKLMGDTESSPIKLMGEAEIVQGSRNTVWVISEPGLYKIMLRSRTPKAEAFTRFVTHEVLPSIRRCGYYITEERRKQLEGIESELERVEVLLKAELKREKPKKAVQPVNGVYVRNPELERLIERQEWLTKQKEGVLTNQSTPYFGKESN